MEKGGSEGFRMNNIVKNAREVDSPFIHGHHPPSMKSMTTVNRGQLTPLKKDHKDRSKQEMTFEMMAERKNAKGQKLNPISGESLKHL